jgi:UPF0271 protein
VNTRTIDLNCDLGERDDPSGIASDLAILDLVSSANIACGGHAGNEQSMARTVRAAMERGVALGAHPGYPDQANFGRAAREMSAASVEELVVLQTDALLQIALRCGGRLTHLKPHGALYHDAMRRREIAEAVARGAGRIGVPLRLVGLAGAPALEVWRAMGFPVAAEAFADRRYEQDGSLRARSHDDAVIVDAGQAAAQALRIAKGLTLMSGGGISAGRQVDTICVHSDTPAAALTIRHIHDALILEGFRIEALLP